MASAECNPMVRDHFKDSIQLLDTEQTDKYSLKNHLQDHISDLIAKKEFSLVDTLKADLKEYKQQTIAKKETFLSSLRYALIKKLPITSLGVSRACADSAAAFAQFGIGIRLIGWIITGIIAEDTINNKESLVPITEFNDAIDGLTVKSIKWGLTLFSLSAINELIRFIQDRYHGKFENLDTKINIIDELIQFADKQKASAN